MRIFLAGGTGAVGRRLIPLLVEAGHQVTALTRTDASARAAGKMGAQPVMADALNGAELAKAVQLSKPQAVIHQLTALADAPGNLRRFDKEFAGTNLLRTSVLDTMLKAAQDCGARRFIAQSFCGWPQARSGSWIKAESDALEPHPAKEFRHSQAAIQYLERAVPQASGIDGIVLRYGVLYGPGTHFAEDGSIVELIRKRRLPIVGGGTGVWSFTHVDDAAAATLAALDHGNAGIYNIVDDDPAPVSEWLPAWARAVGAPPPRHVPAWLGRLALGTGGLAWVLQGRGSSNAKAKEELGWRPLHPSWRTGMSTCVNNSVRAVVNAR
jgi:nucleoside-diphosphate-sugar epimerase